MSPYSEINQSQNEHGKITHPSISALEIPLTRIVDAPRYPPRRLHSASAKHREEEDDDPSLLELPIVAPPLSESPPAKLGFWKGREMATNARESTAPNLFPNDRAESVVIMPRTPGQTTTWAKTALNTALGPMLHRFCKFRDPPYLVFWSRDVNRIL